MQAWLLAHYSYLYLMPFSGFWILAGSFRSALELITSAAGARRRSFGLFVSFGTQPMHVRSREALVRLK